ncbi:hypothetical protein RND81_08G142300 [Saponaria officinalis]|uniref:RRM domain-containing protein n=1 Tax=Saponaria officinalis TaxID=3572 RepID=A0AAW1J8R6_SAPOF
MNSIHISHHHQTCLPHSLKNSSSIHLCISNSTLHFPLKSHFYPLKFTSLTPTFELHSSAQEVVIQEVSENKSVKRKLFVFNFPWSFSPDDLKTVFSQCGTVKEAEIIRNKDGKYRGYAFITMSSGEEAQAVVDKFNLKELGGRIIKVEFAKRLRKPRPQPPIEVPVTETRHKLYVSNLQWKVRSSDLRQFFSADFNPVSARVVFESPNGRSAGYGFASFGTREEAEAAISSLNGKELLGRPVILKFSERTTDGEAENKDVEEEKKSEDETVSSVGEEVLSEAEHES